MDLLNSSDFLNVQKARNEKNTEAALYNCGGYALRTYSWYRPSEDIDVNEEIQYWIDLGYSEEAILEKIYEIFITALQNDFGKDIRLLQFNSFNKEADLVKQLKENEELIAFRIGFSLHEFIGDYTYDFHFRVRRNNKWFEKKGSSKITYCGFSEADWDGFCVYNGPIYYFAKKIA